MAKIHTASSLGNTFDNNVLYLFHLIFLILSKHPHYDALSLEPIDQSGSQKNSLRSIRLEQCHVLGDIIVVLIYIFMFLNFFTTGQVFSFRSLSGLYVLLK